MKAALCFNLTAFVLAYHIIIYIQKRRGLNHNAETSLFSFCPPPSPLPDRMDENATWAPGSSIYGDMVVGFFAESLAGRYTLSLDLISLGTYSAMSLIWRTAYFMNWWIQSTYLCFSSSQKLIISYQGSSVCLLYISVYKTFLLS